MPVVNCLITEDALKLSQTDSIVQYWADLSNINPMDITINILPIYQQLGVGYPIFATMYLPSIWSSEAIKRIQLGLLKTLLVHSNRSKEEVFIVSILIDSGHVVENGIIQQW